MPLCYDPVLGRETMVTTDVELFVSFLQWFLRESGGWQSEGRVSSPSVFEEQFVGFSQRPTSIFIFIDTRYRLNIGWVLRLLLHNCAIVEPLSCWEETYEE